MKSFLGLLSIIATFPVLAETSSSEYGIIGLNSSFGSSVFSSKGSENISITPNLFYSGDLGFIKGSLLNLNILPYVGISANWRFEEVSESANDIVTGINDRQGNPELGITFGTAGARVTYLHDVSNTHKGQEIQFHLGRTFDTPINNFSLTPFIEADWRDKKLSQHLYGISTAESTQSGLSRFDAGNSWVYQAGVIGLYDLSERWVLFNQFQLQHHTSNSELIQRDIGWSVEFGLAYKFIGN